MFRGLSVLDLVVVLAMLALLVFVVRLDWPPTPDRPGGSPPPAALAAP